MATTTQSYRRGTWLLSSRLADTLIAQAFGFLGCGKLSLFLFIFPDFLDHGGHEVLVAGLEVALTAFLHALGDDWEAIAIEDGVDFVDYALCFGGHFVNISLGVLIPVGEFVNPASLAQTLQASEVPRHGLLVFLKLVVTEVPLVVDVEQNIQIILV